MSSPCPAAQSLQASPAQSAKRIGAPRKSVFPVFLGGTSKKPVLQTILKPNSRSAMPFLQPSGNLNWLTATLPPLVYLPLGGHLERPSPIALPSFQKAVFPHSSAASGLSPDPASGNMCGEGAFPLSHVRGGQSQLAR